MLVALVVVHFDQENRISFFVQKTEKKAASKDEDICMYSEYEVGAEVNHVRKKGRGTRREESWSNLLMKTKNYHNNE